MRAIWWYRGGKEQNINKIKLIISKTIKIYTTGFETVLMFSPNFTALFTFFKNYRM